ncbi:hypothetical protein Tco_1210996 [Tanacetum coccineum]
MGYVAYKTNEDVTEEMRVHFTRSIRVESLFKTFLLKGKERCKATFVLLNILLQVNKDDRGVTIIRDLNASVEFKERLYSCLLEQVTNFDEDVDDLALNMDHIYRWSIFEVHVMQSDVQNNYVVDSDADYTSDSNIIPYDQYVEGQKEHISVNATTLLKLSSELRRRMCGNPKAKTVDNAVEKTSRFGQQKATV